MLGTTVSRHPDENRRDATPSEKERDAKNAKTAQDLASRTRVLSVIGQSVSHYKIIEKLGEGRLAPRSPVVSTKVLR